MGIYLSSHVLAMKCCQVLTPTRPNSRSTRSSGPRFSRICRKSLCSAWQLRCLYLMLQLVDSLRVSCHAQSRSYISSLARVGLTRWSRCLPTMGNLTILIVLILARVPLENSELVCRKSATSKMDRLFRWASLQQSSVHLASVTATTIQKTPTVLGTLILLWILGETCKALQVVICLLKKVISPLNWRILSHF